MDLKLRKLILEVYGILRIFLGVGQLVGLAGGYFMTEFIVRYPDRLMVNGMNDDMVVLSFLAALLRGLFHTFAGAGIARIKLWARFWLLGGWPMMLIITVGFAYALWRDWSLQGFSVGLFSSIAWFKVIVYIAWILFDLLFVCKSIALINLSKEENFAALSFKRLGLILFLSGLSFTLFIFLGRPVREGFHAGFYKRGFEQSREGKLAQVLTPSRTEAVKDAASSDPRHSVEQNAPAERLSVGAVRGRPDEGRWPPKAVRDAEKETAYSGMDYGIMIGISAGFFIFLAFLSYIMDIIRADGTASPQLLFYVFLSLGFLLWCIYGFSVKSWLIVIMNGLSGLLSLCLLTIKFKSELR